jgi:hypothetical protein
MTRRDFLWMAAAVTGAPSGAQAPLILPVHRVMDIRTRVTPERLNHFWWRIWPEAVRSFSRGGIQLQCTDTQGEIKLTAGDRPIFVGLQRGVINLVLTDHLPMNWDKARSLAGMTTIYEGYHLCVIAISYAHGYQVPFISTNTCVHEMLHLLLQDVFVKRPKWYQVSEREVRADWYATQLWLFHDGGAIRKLAAVYLERLRSSPATARSSDFLGGLAAAVTSAARSQGLPETLALFGRQTVPAADEAGLAPVGTKSAEQHPP